MNFYTAEELITKLHEENNIIISLRTLNYYAYDKKMFPNLQKGKKAFSDNECELINRISYLKDKTSLTLDEIKVYINDDNKYNEIVNSIVSDTVTRSGLTSPCFASNNSVTSYTVIDTNISDIVTSNYDTTMTNKVSFPSSSLLSNHYSSNLNSIECDNFIPQSQTTELPTYSRDTTVRINKDVTITVSSNISKEKLIKIINFINSL